MFNREQFERAERSVVEKKMFDQKRQQNFGKHRAVPHYNNYTLYFANGGTRDFTARNDEEALHFLQGIMDTHHKLSPKRFRKSGFANLVRVTGDNKVIIFPPPHKTNGH